MPRPGANSSAPPASTSKGPSRPSAGTPTDWNCSSGCAPRRPVAAGTARRLARMRASTCASRCGATPWRSVANTSSVLSQSVDRVTVATQQGQRAARAHGYARWRRARARGRDDGQKRAAPGAQTRGRWSTRPAPRRIVDSLGKQAVGASVCGTGPAKHLVASRCPQRVPMRRALDSVRHAANGSVFAGADPLQVFRRDLVQHRLRLARAARDRGQRGVGLGSARAAPASPLRASGCARSADRRCSDRCREHRRPATPRRHRSSALFPAIQGRAQVRPSRSGTTRGIAARPRRAGAPRGAPAATRFRPGRGGDGRAARGSRRRRAPCAASAAITFVCRAQAFDAFAGLVASSTAARIRSDRQRPKSSAAQGASTRGPMRSASAIRPWWTCGRRRSSRAVRLAFKVQQ